MLQAAPGNPTARPRAGESDQARPCSPAGTSPRSPNAESGAGEGSRLEIGSVFGYRRSNEKRLIRSRRKPAGAARPGAAETADRDRALPPGAAVPAAIFEALDERIAIVSTAGSGGYPSHETY
jgi:hypothetical protein